MRERTGNPIDIGSRFLCQQFTRFATPISTRVMCTLIEEFVKWRLVVEWIGCNSKNTRKRIKEKRKKILTDDRRYNRPARSVFHRHPTLNGPQRRRTLTTFIRRRWFNDFIKDISQLSSHLCLLLIFPVWVFIYSNLYATSLLKYTVEIVI